MLYFSMCLLFLEDRVKSNIARGLSEDADHPPALCFVLCTVFLHWSGWKK